MFTFRIGKLIIVFCIIMYLIGIFLLFSYKIDNRRVTKKKSCLDNFPVVLIFLRELSTNLSRRLDFPITLNTPVKIVYEPIPSVNLTIFLLRE